MQNNERFDYEKSCLLKQREKKRTQLKYEKHDCGKKVLNKAWLRRSPQKLKQWSQQVAQGEQ